MTINSINDLPTKQQSKFQGLETYVSEHITDTFALFLHSLISANNTAEDRIFDEMKSQSEFFFLFFYFLHDFISFLL